MYSVQYSIIMSGPHRCDGPPGHCLIYGGLLFAVSTCSSASVVFTVLVDQMKVPPSLSAAWRLCWVTIIQFFPFIWTLRQIYRKDLEQSIVSYWRTEGTALLEESSNTSDTLTAATEGDTTSTAKKKKKKKKKKNPDVIVEPDHYIPMIPRIIKAIPQILLSGICLGIHFSSWTYSLRETSLTHSLLWVAMGPIIICGSTWLVFLAGWIPAAPSCLETVGTLVGLAGAIVMLLDIATSTSTASTITHDENNLEEKGSLSPTFRGDMIAFLGAVAVSAYLVIGQRLRVWMPLWIYSFTVVAVSCVTSLILAFVLGELSGGPPLLGLFQDPYIYLVIYLAVGPSIGGHTLLNYLVKYVSPLAISTAMLAEPLVGSIMGYVAGMQKIPGPYTWLGGGVLLCGLFTILYSEHKKQQAGSF